MPNQYQNVFERFEKKYLLKKSQYKALSGLLAGRLEPDRYGLSTICSVYYDTRSYSLIRASLDKPVYKEKLRMRSYGVPGPEDTVYIELKKKFRDVVYKRRAALPLWQAEAYLLDGVRPGAEGAEKQILNEIDWFLQKYPLMPRAFIAYDRTAFCGAEDPALRVTFDQNIRWRDRALSLADGDQARRLLGRDSILMEIKTLRAIPLWFSRALSELEIYPASFSKYGTCYREHLASGGEPKGEIICA